MPSDDQLAGYRRKRDFGRTPEPSGAPGGHDGHAGAGGGRRFVVQRHRASSLHYDFRLEIDGVLVSWAVPKGPTLDPKARRAAFHVEDHPLDYFDFEGVIPKGDYGGGDVIVWDAGTWTPYKDPDPGAAVAAGELHMQLEGQKLRGRFVIVRTRRGRGGKDDWLLLHKRDEHAVEGWDAEEHPRSVLSGRTNDEVLADPDRAWSRQGATVLKVGDEELRELDTLKDAGRWHVFGRELRVTNLDKVLFPPREAGEAPVTKRELLRYTAIVAPVLQPYLTGRALNLHRYPGGAGTAGFWQQHLSPQAPGWLNRWEGRLVVDEPAALVWAANFGGLEWHPWTSPVDRPDEPSYALIDLDPGTGTAWEDILVLARLHRTAFEHLGVTARPKLTGRRGLQIWVPVAAGLTFDDTRDWVETLSRSVGAVVPDLVSWKWQRDERGGLARLDYTQNAVNKTLVAPYSPRPAPGAPVSAPIEWDELDDPALTPDRYTVRSVPARLKAHGDLFADVLEHRQRLPKLT